MISNLKPMHFKMYDFLVANNIADINEALMNMMNEQLLRNIVSCDRGVG